MFLTELWYKEYGRYKIFAYAGSGMVVLAVALLAAVLRLTYDYSGIFLIVLFYLYLKHTDRWSYSKRCLTLSAICVIFYGMQLVPDIFTEDIYLLWESEKYWLLGLIPVAPLMAAYDRKRGYRSRWFNCLYSTFYPMHLLLITAIAAWIVA